MVLVGCDGWRVVDHISLKWAIIWDLGREEKM